MENIEVSEEFFMPAPPLDEVINNFYCIKRLPEGAPITRHFSPNFEMVLVFNFGLPLRGSMGNLPLGDLQIDDVAVLGPLKQILHYELLPNADLIIVTFKLNGFFRLFNMPLNKLDGKGIYDPDAWIGKPTFKHLWKKLKDLKRTGDRIQLLTVEGFTLIKPNNEIIQSIVDSEFYFHDPLVSPVKAMAADAKVTERAIQLQFQKQTGYSPKELIRFLRFKELITALVAQPDKEYDVFELIQTYGYHDQSHLIKDFQQFLGTTPLDFLKNLKGSDFCVAGQHPAFSKDKPSTETGL